MSVISAMRAYLLACPYISGSSDEIRIEYPDATATSYALASTGTSIVKQYLGGTAVIEHDFVLYAYNVTIEDASRLANSGFFEDLEDWLRANNLQRDFPVCSGVEFDSITSSAGMLFDLEETGDHGTYQIQLKAIYTKG